MSMKRYLAAFGAAALVFAAVYGAAAALDINDPGVAQSGQAGDLQCDTNGVTVDGYFLETNQLPRSRSFGVVVSGINEDCEGRTLVARTFDGNGDQLGRGVLSIGSSGTERVRYAPEQGGTNGVLVEAIDSVELTIG